MSVNELVIKFLAIRKINLADAIASLLFFDHKKWRFMGVPKNGGRRARHMINRIIAPFTTGNTAAVSGKNLP